MAFLSSSRLISSSSQQLRKLLLPNSPPSSFIRCRSRIIDAPGSRSNYPFLNSTTGRPPLTVPSLMPSLMDAIRRRDCPHDDRHYLIGLYTNGLHYESEDQVYEDCVNFLAPFVGSKEEAKKRIYLVSLGEPYGFGAELDKEVASTLVAPHVFRDPNYTQSKLNLNPPHVQLSPKFTPINWDQRLENIFSYHYLSKEKKNKLWKDDHWLIALKQPAMGFYDFREIHDHIVQLLTNILGSEEEACKRIYIVWYKLPYGFGAEIDKEASEKLREMKDDVLAVLPDYAFDVQDEKFVDRALNIYPLPSYSVKVCPWLHGSRFSYRRQNCIGVDKESHEPIGRSAKSDLAETSECKYWFISMKKPVGDASLQQQLDASVETIAKACRSGKEEAKKKIYRYQNGDDGTFSFGAAIDAETSKLLEGEGRVLKVHPDDVMNQFPRDDILFRKVFKELKHDMRRLATSQ